MRAISLLIIVLLYGCNATETIIKPKEIVIETPAFNLESDSFTPFQSEIFIDNNLDIPSDSSNYYATFQFPNSDEKATVKVYPKKKKAILEVPKQINRTTIQDTTKYTIKKTTTTVEKFGYGVYGIIAAVFLIIIGWLVWKKYSKII